MNYGSSVSLSGLCAVSMHRLHWKEKRSLKKFHGLSVSPLWAESSYQGALVSLDYVLNKPPFEPQKGQARSGLGYRGPFCLEVGIIPWFLFTSPQRSSFPFSNSFFKNVSCCFFNSACVWADVQESSLQQGQQEQGKILHFNSVPLALASTCFSLLAFNSS